mgnify:CR=1 FL=1
MCIRDRPLERLHPPILADLRDRRLKDGVRACQYDLVLIRHAWNIASIEWGWNLGHNPVINQFAIMGAESFPNVPYEELYDLEKDPYQKVNLIENPKYKKIRNRLSVALENWMKSQGDFLLDNPISVLKPTLHPLDKNSKWNKVPDDLIDKLNDDDYVKLHY